MLCDVYCREEASANYIVATNLKNKSYIFPFFLFSRDPTHHSFFFNSQSLYELRRKVRLSKRVCGIFHFQFRFAFIKVYIFVQQKAWTP